MLDQGFGREQILSFVAQPVRTLPSFPHIASAGLPPAAQMRAPNQALHQVHGHQQQEHVREPRQQEHQLAQQTDNFGHVYADMHARFGQPELAQPQHHLVHQHGAEWTSGIQQIMPVQQDFPQAQLQSQDVNEMNSMQNPIFHPQHNQLLHEENNFQDLSAVRAAVSQPVAFGQMPVDAPVMNDQHSTNTTPARAKKDHHVRERTPGTGRGRASGRCVDCQKLHKRCTHRVEGKNGAPGRVTSMDDELVTSNLGADQQIYEQQNGGQQMWQPKIVPDIAQLSNRNVQAIEQAVSGAANRDNTFDLQPSITMAADPQGDTIDANQQPMTVEIGNSIDSQSDQASTAVSQPVQEAAPQAQQPTPDETVQYEIPSDINGLRMDNDVTATAAEDQMVTAGTGVKPKAAPKKRAGGRKRSKSNIHPVNSRAYD